MLEGGRALVFASGMAAISATLSLPPDGPMVARTSGIQHDDALLHEMRRRPGARCAGSTSPTPRP